MALKKKAKAKPRNRSRKPATGPRPEIIGHLMPGLAELLPGRVKMEKFLDLTTQRRLEAFCLAHHGADPRVVIHKAVEDFIEHDLSDNVGVATEFKAGPTRLGSKQ